jgi:hypothetical protein
VPNEVSYAKAGRAFVAQPLPLCVAKWVEAEAALMQTV